MAETSLKYDDDALVAGLRDGEEEAFTQVFRQFHQRLYFFARRFVEEADAKDMVSEAFAQLWQKRTGFEHMAAISHFLFVTVRNRCLNLARNQLVREQHHTHILNLLEQSEEPDLFREELMTRLVGMIYKEIEQLPPRMQEIFLLSFNEELSPSEIAARLGISVQTVKNKKLAAIRLLQAALEPNARLLALLLLVSTISQGSGASV